MLQDMRDNDTSTRRLERRVDISKNSHADTAARVFAQLADTHTIDITRFISMLDDEGVTVSGGEPVLDLTTLAAIPDSTRCWPQPGTGSLGGAGYTKSFTYEIKSQLFTATVKYAKNNISRHIELLTIVRPNKNDGGMVVYARQILHAQGNELLNKCDRIMAANIAKVRREQQEKFDVFLTSLVLATNE